MRTACPAICPGISVWRTRSAPWTTPSSTWVSSGGRGRPSLSVSTAIWWAVRRRRKISSAGWHGRRPNTNSGVPVPRDFFRAPACDILGPVRSSFDTGGNLATAANVLSALRIAAAPVVFLLIIRSGDGSSAAAALVFLTAAFTDFLDGQLARRTATVTSMGRILDPLADRVLIGSVVIALAVV
ncbi:MAG TPA: CDP-alcohol phosphatidyltransferase family protein, partial [Actinobacteria bacterium]|nr:CDP-alcohol phosphatidyltransferase family protein [Actinomycetota bacterium]